VGAREKGSPKKKSKKKKKDQQIKLSRSIIQKKKKRVQERKEGKGKILQESDRGDQSQRKVTFFSDYRLIMNVDPAKIGQKNIEY